jgi:tetratricopeptide (TPR) repeat protein
LNPPTDWASAIAILAGGLLLGVLFAYFFGRRKAATISDNLAVKDLEAKRDALIAQLRDESLTGDERERLESETAAVLRQLDQSAKSAAPVAKGESAPETPAGPLAMNPTVKGFFYGAASFAALAALGYFVYTKMDPRQEGGTVTGNLPGEQQGMQQQQQPPDAMLMQLQSAVQADPNNLQLRNDLAQAYLERDNMMAVFEQTQFVLAKSPEDSRALTFQALVRMAMGEQDEAADMLRRAAKSDPKNLDSWVALAWLHTQQDKLADAEAAIAEAKKQSPGDVARLDEVFTQMKAQAKMAAAGAGGGGGQLPEGHPPIDGAPPAAPAAVDAAPMPAAGAGGPSLNVTIDIDPAARAKSGVLFVMARNPMGGPPVAVKRIMASSFPITFTLGQADSMMGQPLPAKFRLEARLDSDGDAATKLPTDPTALQNDVTPGTSVTLALK